MLKVIKKENLYTFLVGASVGVATLSVILLVMVLNGSLQRLLAAGVGTGAPDVNARYLDGYGTSLSAAANKIYVSDASGYLPDNSVDSGAIVDGAITSADIAADTIAAGDIAAGAVGTSEIADGSVTSADIADGTITNADLQSYTAGDLFTAASDAEASTGATTYTKLKEIWIPRGGTLRIKFDLRTTSDSATAYAVIYRNGTQVGTVRSTTSTSYVTYSEDIAGWSAGDLVQLYAKISNTYTAYVQNFRIYTAQGTSDPHATL